MGMMKNELENQNICFIACTNDPVRMEECMRYIARLDVPEGVTVQTVTITDARSMCEGYNRAMSSSDARYKVYLHQDTFILNRYFLHNLLAIFRSDEQIGMVGMVGTPQLHPSGIMWCGSYIGSMYEPEDVPYDMERLSDKLLLSDVESIDGFLMATAYDLPWRDNLFDGFDFYDVSQSFEFRRAGYRVVVPDQASPWCLHDDRRILSLYHYNHYRRIFLDNYAKELKHVR